MKHYYKIEFYIAAHTRRWGLSYRSPVSSLKEAREVAALYVKARIIKVTEKVIK